jgi:hypothetical protein
VQWKFPSGFHRHDLAQHIVQHYTPLHKLKRLTNTASAFEIYCTMNVVSPSLKGAVLFGFLRSESISICIYTKFLTGSIIKRLCPSVKKKLKINHDVNQN